MPGRKKSENSLYLVGDGDDVDILYDIEAAFGVTIADGEAAKLYTLGDLQDLLAGKLNATAGRRDVCLTAATFFRLRRALTAQTGVAAVRPRTKLSELFPGREFARRKPALENASGLTLPPPAMGMLATALAIVLMLGPPVAALAAGPRIGGWAWAVLLAWAALVPLIKFGAVRPPHRCDDFGRLAKLTAWRNIGRFASDRGSCHRDDVWQALIAILDEHGLSQRPVDRRTTFFAAAETWNRP